MRSDSSGDGDFTGTERYQVRRRLGSGGFGVVYQAFDVEHGTEVALKVLRQLDPSTLYRFKNEFRALAGVAHPNLVGLRELVSVGERWFFTMELVDGVNFLEHVWRAPAPITADEDTAPTPSPGSALARATRPAPSIDGVRLRAGLRSLVEGVAALHHAGRLHRDIKPSNVLVSREGRVVLLDFGLVADVEDGPAGDSTDAIVGTVAYMAPEQGAREKVSAASDWYSVGALLYECLTGRVPFVGSAVQVLLDKSRLEPPPPSWLAPGIPADLDQLCVDLLRREPGRRPGARDILERIGAPAGPVPVAALRRAEPGAAFVGRSDQLAQLGAALDEVSRGKSAAVFVKGRSGMGKTALVRHFLEGLDATGQVTVLQGRCYQREFVPYKALDSLVDALARRLSRLPPHQIEALLPRDVQALAQVFPVLRRVEQVANAQRRVPQAPDPQELRRRAFAGLRELLARFSDRTRLVLFIDDLQWGDADGFALLAELFRPPDQPALLFIGSYRLEEEAACLVLKAMVAAHAARSPAISVRELEVELLSPDEALNLARARLSGAAGAGGATAESIARECGGSPFFLDVLAAWASGPRRPEISLDQVLRERIGALEPEQRRLLEVVAVAGRPVSRAVAFEAGGPGADPVTAQAALEAGRFLRATQGQEIETLEMFHDRLRESVLAGLAPEALARLHLKLAHALEGSLQRDDETLARHYADGGERELAAAHAAVAAVGASEALAFDHSAFLFQWALELVPASDPRRRHLEAQLGDALALAGRGPEAAAAYFRALEAPAPLPLSESEALDLRRRAAEQLLRSGHTDEGLAAIRSVLEGVELKLARSPQTARASLSWRRVRVWARGLTWKERPAAQLSPEVINRIDVCWAAAQGLGMVDVIRGAAFQAKHLLLALDAGEPYRVARALATEASFVAVGGTHSEARVNAILAEADALARRLDHPHALGLVRFSEAMRELLCGRWRTAHRCAEEAVQIFRDRAQGVAFERVNAQLVSLWSLFFLGELRELSSRVQALRAEALVRGDQYAVTASGLSNLALLVEDEPEKARQQFEDSLENWSTQGFHLPHYWGLLARALVDFYRGEDQAPYARVQAAWPHLRSSLLLNIQHVRITSLHLRAHSALQAATASAQRERLWAVAEADARRIEKEQAPWSEPLVWLLRGSLAVARGQKDPGTAALERAEALFTRQDMAAFAAATRWRRGTLLEGQAGTALRASAEEWMQQQGVRNPQRFCSMLIPRN